MSNSSKIDLNKLRQEGLKEIFTILEKAFEEAGIDFYYIIGALARDIWFSKEGKVSRATKDIDFAALIAGKEQFEKVKEILKSKHAFTESRGNAFALISPEGRTIDILPFGDIEVNEGVVVEGMGLSTIKVNGFKEVGVAGVEEIEIGSSQYQVATLPSIVLLKLIAYDDRPEHRQNDAGDIAHIIGYYFDIETDR
jgi:predicted nucleotidyltransferase